MTHSHIPRRKEREKKKNSDSNPDTTRSLSSTFSHLMTVFNMLYLSAVAFTLIFVIWISRQCPFIKVVRQSRRTFLLLYLGLLTKSEDLSVVVLSFLSYFFFIIFIFFISFPLSAFCDFSAIFYRIFLIFGQLIDINL